MATESIIVRPRESFEILTNPGMGWTTFFSFNGDEINQRYPRCSMAYFRFYWDELEPQPGEYRWDLIDDLIKTGRRKGQSIALRIMAMDGEEWAAKWRNSQLTAVENEPKNHRVPNWFRELGAGGMEFFDHDDWLPGTPPMWEPDYGDQLFLEYHGAFIAALGERYDGNPGIDHVDIGSVGRWGEWHCAAVPTPSLSARQRIVDNYVGAFRKTPLLMLIADQEALSHAINRGTGWRADCLGDCRQDFFNPDWEGGTPHWNHTEDVYLQRLVGARALKTWKKAPVAFESCWSLEHWYDQGWPIQCIFDYALALHCSIFNNKSRPVPDACWPYVDEFLKRMGYRFVLRSLEYPNRVKPGVGMPVSMVWENKGVSVCHHKYELAFRLAGVNGITVIPCEATLSGILPGRHTWSELLRIPDDTPIGSCQLSAALLDLNTKQPAVFFANEGRETDGWCYCGDIEIR